jgi:hypothetical protein
LCQEDRAKAVLMIQQERELLLRMIEHDNASFPTLRVFEADEADGIEPC